MTDVSLALAQMIGQDSEQGLAAVSDDRLLLKTQLCSKLADLIKILAPDTGRRKSLVEGPMVMLGYVT
ncbi:Sanna, partial [Operophtera brumata]